MMIRLASLYPAGAECYAVQLQPGFTAHIKPDTSEILLGGGTSLKLKDHPALKKELFQFITSTKLPIMGICFGMQIIGRAFGASIVQLPVASDGLKNIRILQDKAEFQNKYIAQIYKKQYWSLQELPAELTVFACSADGIDAFMHAQRPIAGVQFHPEQFGQISDGKLIFDVLRRKVLARVASHGTHRLGVL